MYRKLAIATIVFILFIHLFNRTSATEECFANINDFNDGYCQCEEKSSEVSCSINNVSSDHIFWDAFGNITGFPTSITVNVIDFEVTYFPSSLFLNLPLTVEEVKLKSWSFESIPEIPVAIISQNKSSLRILEITGNENLTAISSFAFSLINSLHRLILSSNSLSNLTANSFINLIKLRDLRLDNNKIVSLPEKIFKSLKHLGNLTLANNEITSIRRETFTGLSSLVELDINRNKLLIIKNDTFHEMRKLKSLDLTYNFIDTIEQAAFRGLVALESLDLSDNQLRHLPNGVFEYTGNLTLVDLKDNLLTKLDFDLYKQLPKTTFMKDNPWVCDCSLYIHIEKIIEWNIHSKCQYYADFNENGQAVKPVTMLFKQFAEKIEKSPKKAEKCADVMKTIEKRSHKVVNYTASKFIKSSSNQLMPFMSFIFIMLLLPGLDN